MGAWARAGWRVWDLGNGTIMLQKLFNPERQITSKSFLLSSFLIGFSFSPTAEFAAENRVKEGIGQESNGAANQEKQIFLLCQIPPSASSTRDLGTRFAAFCKRATDVVVKFFKKFKFFTARESNYHQTFEWMNSKEKIAYLWRIGWKLKAYTSCALYLKVFKTDLYL